MEGGEEVTSPRKLAPPPHKSGNPRKLALEGSKKTSTDQGKNAASSVPQEQGGKDVVMVVEDKVEGRLMEKQNNQTAQNQKMVEPHKNYSGKRYHKKGRDRRGGEGRRVRRFWV